jgi:dATP pyrophosphohydrolase
MRGDDQIRTGQEEKMRAPFQVLVIPYRWMGTTPEFAVFRRSDTGWWQFVAGGGEDGETPLRAAQRETGEEIGIANGFFMPLDSMATVPKNCFKAAKSWGSGIYVIPEHCFAVDVRGSDLRLSREHTEVRWATYADAASLLKWDSNRNALWELNERLRTTRRNTATCAADGASSG